ncbi:TonB-dependent receptor [Sphingosinicella sp. LHD-64]|uniref:TonB-dependent receptor n=1 Tax=Sphingosinicella sp. LHD-64 TaxID=3072139 RepID=UPI00280C5BF4|nr:TonB-dependent receptor [Sphingosinicella sp. LHD-64]MDQ8757433.1 TonB-dependent receptor [Sphingosinicella sp. LHD-64]
MSVGSEMKKPGYLSAVSILACAAAMSVPVHEAHAQEAGADAAVGEIVITANKRTQNLQDTPMAITAIASEQLVASGVTDIRGVQNLVPSVRFQAESTSTQVYMRGVGSTLDFPQLEPPTAIHFNGIYMPREATSIGLYDVAQIEVLPGPQGTLYGRGSLGGIVNVNFARPTRDFEVRGLVEYGNYDMLHGSASINVPLGDTLSVRLAGDYLRRDGYMESGADSADNYGVRLSLLWQPTDRFSAYLWGSIAELDGVPANLVVKGVDPQTGALRRNAFLQENPWNDQLPPPYAAGLPFGQPNQGEYAYRNNMVGGEISFDLTDDVQLVYVPSYLDFSVDGAYWLAAFPANKRDNYEQMTHELRLSGEGDWGSWLVGLYGYRLVSSGVFTFGGFDPVTRRPGDFFDLGGFANPLSGFPVSVVDRNRLKGAAAFGQVTVNLGDDARLTLGGRYGIDNRVGRGRFFNGTGLAPFTYDAEFERFDYRVVLDYDITDDVMVYVGSQSGFQPGTFNPYANTAAASNAVDAAKLTSYAGGIRSRFAGGRMTLNAELFYYDYRDLFASAYNTVLNLTQTFNADQVEVYGVQIDAAVNLSPDDRFTASVGYTHARNKDFVLPDGTANFNGLQLQYAPDWTISLGYHHDFQLSSGYVRAAVNSRFESSFFADFAQTPGGQQEAYTKTDASLTYYAANERWSLGVWMKNIEDVAVIAATAAGANIPAQPLGATAFLEAPRTYGIRATFNF